MLLKLSCMDVVVFCVFLAVAKARVPHVYPQSSKGPLSTVDPKSLFATVHREGKAKPGTAFGDEKRPLPTNAWWENFVLATDTTSQASNIFQMPYVVLAEKSGLYAMQPFMVGGGGAEQSFDSSQALYLSTKETLMRPVADLWDELSFTLAWQGGNGGAGMSVPLVRGSPYITAEYESCTPQLASQQMLIPSVDQSPPIITVDGKNMTCDGHTPLTGSVFGFSFVQSDATWHFFTPGNASWVCQSKPFSMTATKPLSGAVRLALANNCTLGIGAHHCGSSKKGRDSSAYAALLQKHAARYPVSAAVDYEVSGDLGIVTWAWNIKTLPGWSQTNPLLQLAWPVHLPLFTSDIRRGLSTNPATPFHDLRGPGTAVLGDSWALTYPLFPDVGLHAARPVAEDMRADILDALKGPEGAMWNGSMADKDFDLPMNFQLGAGDTYFSGKMVARLARLLAIADELGESKEAYFTQMRERLEKRIEIWLSPNTTADPFLYDASWGGIVACGCNYDDCGGKCKPHCSNLVTPPEKCPAMSDSGANFGNGFYNDHHFHYGYFVYGAAVAAKFNPSWEAKWREPLLAMIRDFANPSPTDPYFPVVRHKDWFLGFSWAGGIIGFVNGRNQESTSEAINAYYALYALGSSLGEDVPYAKRLKDLGRLLTAMETHSADIYWHVRPGSEIYPKGYDHTVVGILWEHMAEFQTWFGANPYMVNGIQLLPFTPVMEQYLKVDWVTMQFPDYEKSCDGGCASQGWSWQVCLEQAILDPAKARTCLKSLPKDVFSPSSAAANGNSLTNSLHWIATRGVAPVPPTPTPTPTPSPPTPTPTPPTPGTKCKVGDEVKCPGTVTKCAGDQCCSDGSTCPSADACFKGCQKGKEQDCTNGTQDRIHLDSRLFV